VAAGESTWRQVRARGGTSQPARWWAALEQENTCPSLRAACVGLGAPDSHGPPQLGSAPAQPRLSSQSSWMAFPRIERSHSSLVLVPLLDERQHGRGARVLRRLAPPPPACLRRRAARRRGRQACGRSRRATRPASISWQWGLERRGGRRSFKVLRHVAAGLSRQPCSQLTAPPAPLSS
jgi:hypothetical protein